jgi:hypothetical protein
MRKGTAERTDKGIDSAARERLRPVHRQRFSGESEAIITVSGPGRGRSPSIRQPSALLQQHVQVCGGLLSQVFCVLREKSIGAVTPVFLEHGNEFPFGVQL